MSDITKATATVEDVPVVENGAKVEPAEGPVKLFVGRFPRSMSDDRLRSIFARFGDVLECAVMRDAASISKGCAFVRFATLNEANNAIKELNGKFEVDPSLGGLQVQYATGEVERLGLPSNVEGAGHVKLFIGALPRSVTSDDLRTLFEPFGHVAEACVLLDDRGASKGSGFVRFNSQEAAQKAITELDQKQTLAGGTRPVEVRLAQSKTQRQLEASRHVQQFAPASAVVAAAAAAMTGRPGDRGAPMPMYPMMMMPGMPMPMHMPHPAFGYMANGQAQQQYPGMPWHGHPGMPMQHMPMPMGMPADPYARAAPAAEAPEGPAAEPRRAGAWTEYTSPEGKAYYHNSATNVTQWDKPAEFES